MTLAQLALTVLLLGVLGLGANWAGISAIPAYLLAGILLGPNEPHVTSLIQPSEVTEFVAQLGLVFLLFFLGLEFSLDRLRRTGRHVGLGGIGRPRRERSDRPPGRDRGVRLQLRRAHPCRGGLRVLERHHGQGADRLSPPRGRRDGPRSRDPALRGPCDRLRPRVRGDRRRLRPARPSEPSPRRSRSSPLSLAASRWLATTARPAARLAAARVLPALHVRAPHRHGGAREEARHVGGDRRADGGRRALRRRACARRSRNGSSASATSLRRCSSSSSASRSTSERSVGSAGCSRSRCRSRSSARPRPVTSRAASAASLERQSFNAGVALIAHGEFTIILAQLAAGNSRLSDAVQLRPDRVRRSLRARDGNDRRGR